MSKGDNQKAKMLISLCLMCFILIAVDLIYYDKKVSFQIF